MIKYESGVWFPECDPPASPLSGRMNLSKSFQLSELQFLHFKKEREQEKLPSLVVIKIMFKKD